MPTVDLVVPDDAQTGGETRSDAEGPAGLLPRVPARHRNSPYRNANFATDAPIASDAPFASDAPREGMCRILKKVAADAPVKCRIAGKQRTPA